MHKRNNCHVRELIQSVHRVRTGHASSGRRADADVENAARLVVAVGQRAARRAERAVRAPVFRLLVRVREHAVRHREAQQTDAEQLLSALVLDAHRATLTEKLILSSVVNR